MYDLHSFEFEHDELTYSATLQTKKGHHALIIDAMPYLEFRIDLKEIDLIKVALPSDKKGKRPLVSCSTESNPFLTDAIAAAPL
ncbi:hypothetical protein ACS8E9_18780 [Pseudomonas neustonica]|uniref:hypothetical protein n=1 Tax=Pseudomonas neustonica TaxID=2487346 RepID=UPI003F4899B8|tara:strand:- start:24585 stop:24836 length:252 start_codon:yes stop_codon:yes gene_type:complete